MRYLSLEEAIFLAMFALSIEFLIGLWIFVYTAKRPRLKPVLGFVFALIAGCSGYLLGIFLFPLGVQYLDKDPELIQMVSIVIGTTCAVIGIFLGLDSRQPQPTLELDNT